LKFKLLKKPKIRVKHILNFSSSKFLHPYYIMSEGLGSAYLVGIFNGSLYANGDMIAIAKRERTLDKASHTIFSIKFFWSPESGVNCSLLSVGPVVWDSDHKVLYVQSLTKDRIALITTTEGRLNTEDCSGREISIQKGFQMPFSLASPSILLCILNYSSNCIEYLAKIGEGWIDVEGLSQYDNEQLLLTLGIRSYATFNTEELGIVKETSSLSDGAGLSMLVNIFGG
jgi:hypothetical protein